MSVWPLIEYRGTLDTLFNSMMALPASYTHSQSIPIDTRDSRFTLHYKNRRLIQRLLKNDDEKLAELAVIL